MERTPNARRRGALDVAMIGLMRDARLRVSEAAELTWGDIKRVRVVGTEETSYREVSADTMKLLLPVRRGTGDDEPVLDMRPNQIATRIGTAARQAGLGEGYSGDSPRLGMIKGHGDPRRAPAWRLHRRDRTIVTDLPSARRSVHSPDAGDGQESP